MGTNRSPGRGAKAVVLGVPLGYGAGKTGSELGVEAMRLSTIRDQILIDRIRGLGYEAEDFGNVEIVKQTAVAGETENPKYLSELLASCRNISATVLKILEDEAFPVILGGDHSIAIGTFTALQSHYRQRGSELGLIWFDAHADINTPETTTTRNSHGMPLAVLLGHGEPQLTELGGFSPKLNPSYFAHVGARDLDPAERQLVTSLGIRENFFTMADIDRRGMTACVADAIAVASRAPGGFAVTFDVDMLDPTFAPGSGTLVRGGATYREAHVALELIAEHGGMRSFEIVEVNPLLDQSNITVELACELILSALGKTII